MSLKPYALGLQTTLKIDMFLTHRFEQKWMNNTKKRKIQSISYRQEMLWIDNYLILRNCFVAFWDVNAKSITSIMEETY